MCVSRRGGGPHRLDRGGAARVGRRGADGTSPSSFPISPRESAPNTSDKTPPRCQRPTDRLRKELPPTATAVIGAAAVSVKQNLFSVSRAHPSANFCVGRVRSDDQVLRGAEGHVRDDRNDHREEPGLDRHARDPGEAEHLGHRDRGQGDPRDDLGPWALPRMHRTEHRRRTGHASHDGTSVAAADESGPLGPKVLGRA